MKIKKLGIGIYIVETPKKFLGMEIGLRMTIFVLNNGDIILHSPVLLTKELEYELSTLGNIKYLISPNKFHHLYVKDYKNVYTESKLFCVPGLELKRKDQRFLEEFGINVLKDLRVKYKNPFYIYRKTTKESKFEITSEHFQELISASEFLIDNLILQNLLLPIDTAN